MHILVVEDEPPVAMLLRDLLISLGHEPAVVGTAEVALEHLQAERPDAILLDLQLPGMSGLDFLRLRTGAADRIPIVVMSGVSPESQARECLRQGAVDFVGKPITRERLAEIVACLAPYTGAPRAERSKPVERRRAPRVAVALPVRVVEDGGVEWEATSLNLSASGIKLRALRTIPPGTTATIALRLPEDEAPLELPSILVRADLDGYAFHFAHLADWQAQRLGALVQRMTAGQAGPAPHLGIVRTIAQALSRSLDVDETLRVALDALTSVTGHEIASLHLLSADGKILQLHGDRGLLPNLRRVNHALPVGQGLIGRVAATGQRMHLADVRESPYLLPAARAVVEQEDVRGFVCVPVRSHGRILGTLSLGRRMPQPFSATEIELVEAVADQIGLALENARLYSETRRQLEDLKHAEAHLVEGARLSTVGKLAAGLVHEINNPLSVILAQAQLLMTKAQLASADQARLRVIIQETARAARLLQNLLQLSRRGEPQRQPCSLAEQVRWVLELNRPHLERDEVRVVTELSPVADVWADENQIRQVLLNLVQNADQAMAGRPGERVLTVRLFEMGSRARLEICDTGPGIPAQALPRLFEAFFTTKPAGEGTGLGLWVCDSIVEQHGGRLWADNRPQGGAAFVVELPYGPPAA